MDMLASFGCLALSVLLLCVFIWLRRFRRCLSQPVLFDLLVFVACYRVLSNWLVPAITRLFSDWKYERIDNINPLEVLAVYFFDFVSYMIWCLGIMLVCAICSKKFRLPNLGNGQSGLEARLDPLSQFFLTTIALLYFANTVASGSQGEAASSQSAISIFGPTQWLVGPAIAASGAVFAIYLFVLGRAKVGNFPWLVGFGVMFVTLYYSFSTGVRGMLMGPLVWMIFLIYHFRDKVKKIPLLSPKYILVGFLLFVLMTTHDIMVSVREDGFFSDRGVNSRINAILSESLRVRGSSGGESWLDGLLDKVDFRFGEDSRLGVSFLRMVDRGEYAGSTPILSSLKVLLPRVFFPDKGWPCSIDGSQQGMGIYMVQSVIRYGSASMCGFFTGLHGYWEFGILGLLGFSLASGVYIAAWMRFCSRLKYLGLPMMMVGLKPWWLEPKLWVCEIIIQIFSILGPLVLLLFIAKMILYCWERARRLRPPRTPERNFLLTPVTPRHLSRPDP